MSCTICVRLAQALPITDYSEEGGGRKIHIVRSKCTHFLSDSNVNMLTSGSAPLYLDFDIFSQVTSMEGSPSFTLSLSSAVR